MSANQHSHQHQHQHQLPPVHLVQSCGHFFIPTEVPMLSYHGSVSLNDLGVARFSHGPPVQLHQSCRQIPHIPPLPIYDQQDYVKTVPFPSPDIECLIKDTSSCPKRLRGEKRPIPEDHKDEKYYERRKRNNQAAKKSRDARKMREDQVALKAAVLEHENTLLKAQLTALRALLLGAHVLDSGHRPPTLCDRSN